MNTRTAAERAIDKLSAEKRRLVQVPYPSVQQRARLYELDQKLESAWRVVNEMRDGLR